MMVALRNLQDQPLSIINTIKPYENYIYKIRDQIEFFNILEINSSKTININIIKSINRLIICDSNERILILNWVN